MDCNLLGLPAEQSPPPIRQRHLDGSAKGLGICIDDRSTSIAGRGAPCDAFLFASRWKLLGPLRLRPPFCISAGVFPRFSKHRCIFRNSLICYCSISNEKTLIIIRLEKISDLSVTFKFPSTLEAFHYSPISLRRSGSPSHSTLYP